MENFEIVLEFERKRWKWNGCDEDEDTLESSRRAFSRSSGLLSSRTSCSEEAIEDELEEAGEGGIEPNEEELLLFIEEDTDWGNFYMWLLFFFSFFFSVFLY